MSEQLGKVISLILNETFGQIVQQVGNYVFQFGPVPLLYIIRNTNLPISKVKEALCILIKYNLISFSPNRNKNVANYKLKYENILLMLRYPKFINLIKRRFGDECEMIIEEILQKGYLTASELITKIINRLKRDHNKNVTIIFVIDKFEILLNAQYLIRQPYSIDDDKSVPIDQLKDCEKFKMPKLDLKEITLALNDQTRINSNLSDAGIYWCVHFDRFHQDLRDKQIINAFIRKFDENVGEFSRLLLEQMYIRNEPWCESSSPIPIVEIRDIVRKQSGREHLLAFFDQYVNVIEQDKAGLIRKTGEAGGGSFQIHFKQIFNQFTWETIEQIVLEKFDTKGSRIFRLVKLKQFIESDQIQQLAMIPAKEAKRLTYQMFEENFLKVQELRKPIGTGPNKLFTLFYIDITQIVRMMLELCYKTLFNIMIRKNYEKQTNKRIIDKKQRVDTILLGMKNQGASKEQLNDIEEMITPPEKEILQMIDVSFQRLNRVELEVDDTIFLFQMYLKYHSINN